MKLIFDDLIGKFGLFKFFTFQAVLLRICATTCTVQALSQVNSVREHWSTSSRHSSATMASFRMIERALERVYIALLIARLTGVTSASKKSFSATKLAHNGLEKLKKQTFLDFGYFRA